jgi:hypothetical protein
LKTLARPEGFEPPDPQIRSRFQTAFADFSTGEKIPRKSLKANDLLAF